MEGENSNFVVLKFSSGFLDSIEFEQLTEIEAVRGLNKITTLELNEETSPFPSYTNRLTD